MVENTQEVKLPPTQEKGHTGGRQMQIQRGGLEGHRLSQHPAAGSRPPRLRRRARAEESAFMPVTFVKHLQPMSRSAFTFSGLKTSVNVGNSYYPCSLCLTWY